MEIINFSATVRFRFNSRDPNLELFVTNLIAAVKIYDRELGERWNAFLDCRNDLNIHFNVRIIYIVEPDEVPVVEVRFSVIGWFEY